MPLTGLVHHRRHGFPEAAAPFSPCTTQSSRTPTTKGNFPRPQSPPVDKLDSLVPREAACPADRFGMTTTVVLISSKASSGGRRATRAGVGSCRQRPPLCAPYDQAVAVGGSLRSGSNTHVALNEIDRRISRRFSIVAKLRARLNSSAQTPVSLNQASRWLAPLALCRYGLSCVATARSGGRSPEGSTARG